MGEVPLYEWSSGGEVRRTGAALFIECRSLELSERGPDDYRGTSFIRSTPLLGPYSKPVPRNLW